MLRMERTETIPLPIMQASMRWDWETFPEFLDSLERNKVGVNTASLVPYSPLRAWVMGNEAARDPDYTASSDQVAQIKQVLREALQAGGFGFSGSFSMSNRDYDGGYLPTQVAPREELLEMATVMREFNRGSIEWTVQKADGYNYTIVNGGITFEGQKCTGALPGKMLRSYDTAAA
jgi:N-acyl-D-aspartate/D-glutamate deacylase